MVSKLLHEMGIVPETRVLKKERKFLSATDVEEVWELKRQGVKQKHIALTFGVSQSEISRILRGSRHHTGTRPPPLSDETVRLIRQLYAQKGPGNKVTLKLLSEWYNRNISTIRAIVKFDIYKDVSAEARDES